MKNRIEIATERFDQGFSCAQSVFAAFVAENGLDEITAMNLTSGLGAGFGRAQEVCGAVSGAVLAIGLGCGRKAEDGRAVKEEAYALTREFMQRFKAAHGSCCCRELLGGLDLNAEGAHERMVAEGLRERVCGACVAGAVKLVEELL
ncbi:MAG: putative redox-active protein (C_GCAxxG_C_C) [Deltaproteobacteria bacterium ADurb.Bin510]|nr:MAG: putative redox-active protein (C_GCAxxG_C_C) [Deltaproteobacteria bacterium ADurb.Bin510]